jgi:3-hydroxyisobutyrate dehydrogenase
MHDTDRVPPEEETTMNPQSSKVVFVGLGVMGTPIAEHIHRALPVVGVDLSLEARRGAAERGIDTAGSFAAALPGATHVCLMLPTVQASRAVIGEILAQATGPLTVIEFGTVGPDAAIEHTALLEGAGHRGIDAPVIGGGLAAAEQGRLITLVGGTDDAVAAAMPVLVAMSRLQTHLGPAGAGQTMKLVHNSLLASVAVASAEALAVSTRLGIDEKRAFELLASSSTNSFALDWFFRDALDGEYTTGARVSILSKDLQLALALWNSQGVPMSANRAASQVYIDSDHNGLGDYDMSYILRVLDGSHEPATQH